MKESNFTNFLSKTIKKVLDDKKTRDGLVDCLLKNFTSPINGRKEEKTEK